MRKLLFAAMVMAMGMTAGTVSAQELVGSYFAVIGRDDLYNSKGQRLTEPWQILRQDRANYHRFGIRQPGDTSDSFFSSMENRAIMERMVMNGTIANNAANAIVSGSADAVLVRIYGSGNTGYSIRVTVVD